jgi:hypothetical protein
MKQLEVPGGDTAGARRTPPRGTIRVLLCALALTLGALGAIALVCAKTGVLFSDLTRDSSETLEIPFYLGAVSDLGLLLWSSTAAVCLFAASFPAPDPMARERGRFLFVSGLVTAWLALDDLLTLHEVVIPSAFPIRQRYVLSAYAAGMLFYLFRFRKLILQTDAVILMTSLFFFAVSVASDAVQLRYPLLFHHHLEDGAKFVGLVAWGLYFIRMSRMHVVARPALDGGGMSVRI